MLTSIAFQTRETKSSNAFVLPLYQWFSCSYSNQTAPNYGFCTVILSNFRNTFAPIVQFLHNIDKIIILHLTVDIWSWRTNTNWGLFLMQLSPSYLFKQFICEKPIYIVAITDWCSIYSNFYNTNKLQNRDVFIKMLNTLKCFYEIKRLTIFSSWMELKVIHLVRMGLLIDPIWQKSSKWSHIKIW